MRRAPALPVMAYLRACRAEDLFLPSVVLAELRCGFALLPAGQRRASLQADFEGVLAQGFADRILSLDASCASGYATARSARARIGRPVAPLDALIGGMALAHGATLATRNISDFDGYGLSLIDPWTAA